MAKVNFILEDIDSNYFLSEAYKTLRTNFIFSGSDVQTVIVTSCRMSEGKSTVSARLAESLAKLGKRVLLIDADLRKSSLIHRIPEGIEQGFSHYLSGQCAWEEVLCQTQIENLDVVFSGKRTVTVTLFNEKGQPVPTTSNRIPFSTSSPPSSIV